MDIVSWILSGILGLVIGYLVSNVMSRKMTVKKGNKIIEEAKIEADVLKKDKILQAKEKFLQLKEEHEKVIAERERKMNDAERRVSQKEQGLNNRLQETNRKEKETDLIRKNLNSQLELLDKKQEELSAAKAKQIEKLENIAGITTEDAKQELREVLTEKARTEAMATIKEITDEAKLTANKDAKKIVIQSIQRLATEQAIENAVTVFNISGDEVKGRIIGREGRNIRALEAATGVEVIVDDTPDAIILSCFDPARREVARLALHQLVTDGRIHPARVEEVVRKMTKQLNEEMIDTGKRTCIDLNIHGLHPELIKLVGKMKYRSSYGQNLLQHSREVANLSATMAAELGLDAKLAKRAGLLHDIGKVPDEEPEHPHAILGMKLAQKFKENAEVCNAIGAHHDEIEMTSLISPLVQVCDGISGARPGARRQIVESYINRIKELESLGLSYKGVSQAFAIQAGRELRVIVESEKVSDKEADLLSFDLAQKIQTEMTYPGQVKVTVIRERRAVNIAK